MGIVWVLSKWFASSIPAQSSSTRHPPEVVEYSSPFNIWKRPSAFFLRINIIAILCWTRSLFLKLGGGELMVMNAFGVNIWRKVPKIVGKDRFCDWIASRKILLKSNKIAQWENKLKDTYTSKLGVEICSIRYKQKAVVVFWMCFRLRGGPNLVPRFCD